MNSKVEIESLFDGDDELFKSYLQDCDFYFEYGVGASTSWVLDNSNANIIAVDTNKEWIDYVNINVYSSRAKLIWINLGELTNWGRPNSYKYKDSFIDYVSGVWKFEKKADVVLIDGRFRVACFFYSLLHSKTGSIIIFDDYFNRPFYHVIEEVVSLHKKCGRQAVFKVPRVFDKKLTLNLFNKFLYVFD
jgi:hypothetical protein